MHHFQTVHQNRTLKRDWIDDVIQDLLAAYAEEDISLRTGDIYDKMVKVLCGKSANKLNSCRRSVSVC